MRWTRNALIGCFGLVVVGGVAVTFAWPYLWWRQFGTVVSVNGQPFARAAVYRTWDGTLLVLGGPSDGEGSYTIDPRLGNVSCPEPWELPLRTGFIVVAKDRAKDMCSNGITNAIKEDGAAARVVFRRRRYVEFTDSLIYDPRSSRVLSRRFHVPLGGPRDP